MAASCLNAATNISGLDLLICARMADERRRNAGEVDDAVNVGRQIAAARVRQGPHPRPLIFQLAAKNRFLLTVFRPISDFSTDLWTEYGLSA